MRHLYWFSYTFRRPVVEGVYWGNGSMEITMSVPISTFGHVVSVREIIAAKNDLDPDQVVIQGWTFVGNEGDE